MIKENDDHDLGYSGTLGWSGSETSQMRAEDEAESGLSSARLSLAYDLVTQTKAYGLTYKELGGITDWHHGQSSSVLSNLHKSGDLVRLHDTRNRCKIYVSPEYIEGRETEKFRRNRPRLLPDERRQLIAARNKARQLYIMPSARIDVWPDLPTYEAFWKIITKIIDDQE